MQKYSYQQWQKISKDLNCTKQNLQQLSKLFIIAHEKVKLILRRCQTDLNYDPTEDTERQLNFIRTILEKLANRQNDEYLSVIDPAVIDKYQKHFYGLVQLLRLSLMIRNSQEAINLTQLQRISQKKSIKDQFNLRSQLKKSQQRMIRTKSGHRITKQKNQNIKAQQQQQYNNIITQKNTVQFINSNVKQFSKSKTPEKQRIRNLLQKKQKLQKTINQHIQRQGLTINFKNKYIKLDSYLSQRKQFSDLFFCQKYFDDMIHETKTRKNQTKITQKKDPDINKLFPEFNIKTKYLKKQVRDNIVHVIFQVKKQLLKSYHKSNIVKMTDAHEAGIISLNDQPIKKKKSGLYKYQQMQMRSKSNGFLLTNNNSNCNQSQKMRFKSTNRPIYTQEKRRQSLGQTKNMWNTMSSMKNLRSNNKTKKILYNEEQDQKNQKRFTNIISQNKYQEYHKQRPNKQDRKEHFINNK